MLLVDVSFEPSHGLRARLFQVDLAQHEAAAIVLSERPRHGGNSVLRWMAGDVSIEKDAGDNSKPSKKKSRERIDEIVALIKGLERATTYEVYDCSRYSRY